MKRKIGLLAVCLASYLATLSAGQASDAAAQTRFRRLSAAGICGVNPGEDFMVYQGKIALIGAGVLSMECTIPSDSEFSHKDVYGVAVYGSNISQGTTNLSACVVNSGGTVNVCGNTNSPPATGVYTAYLNTTAWQNTNYATWFPYVDATFSGSGSYVRGIYLYNQ